MFPFCILSEREFARRPTLSAASLNLKRDDGVHNDFKRTGQSGSKRHAPRHHQPVASVSNRYAILTDEFGCGGID